MNVQAIDAVFKELGADGTLQRPCDGLGTARSAPVAVGERTTAARHSAERIAPPTPATNECAAAVALTDSARMPILRKWMASAWLTGGLLAAMYLLITALCGPVPSEPARQHPAAYVTKNIEDLVVGDQVWAEDPATGEKSLRRVVEVYRRRVDHLQIVVLRGSDGSEQTFETTAEHPFWVAGQGWVQAAELKAGQRIRQADGKAAVVVCSRLEPHPEGVEVFNCQVAGLHSYFVVARGSRGPPVLVHNNDDCKKLIQIGLDRVRKAAKAGSNAPVRWGGLTANTAEEAAFLRNVAATFREGSTFRSATRFQGNIVIQRSDIPWSVQNVRNMASGNAPFVRNSAGEWERVNLHHVGRQEGRLIEVLQGQNKYNPATGGPLHIPGPGWPVRDATLTNNYWQQRLRDAINSGAGNCLAPLAAKWRCWIPSVLLRYGHG